MNDDARIQQINRELRSINAQLAWKNCQLFWYHGGWVSTAVVVAYVASRFI